MKLYKALILTQALPVLALPALTVAVIPGFSSQPAATVLQTGGYEMKQYVSVFMLTLRSVHKKLIRILSAMILAEAILFALASRNAWLEDMVSDSFWPWVFLAVFLTLTVALCRCLNGTGRQDYTLQRLSISAHDAFWLQALACMLCYAVLWAVQFLTALLLCKIHASNLISSAGDSDMTGHLVYLAFYRSEFLHNLFPMEDLVCWLRNLILIIELGMSAAYFSHCQRRGKFSKNILIACGLSVLAFTLPLGSLVVNLMIALAAATNIFCIHLAFSTEKPAEVLEDRSVCEEVTPCEETIL